eukprot:CAMPEP_0206601180 /NCGR_PEP_ID=MMETSP0325_2-20121206/46424_1 /ASSEMBLY_ACC=CAM_ASM_000347 /TAXON_ID=2866 /ORGANISM="Crypthecodinium cohnii, Strain Seligo" /LENGTH=54 /DNA_ID=CAMNT_0054112999 /DNA_START=71 /DNA_END=231 /DNA_ORIENTATION=-
MTMNGNSKTRPQVSTSLATLEIVPGRKARGGGIQQGGVRRRPLAAAPLESVHCR